MKSRISIHTVADKFCCVGDLVVKGKLKCAVAPSQYGTSFFGQNFGQGLGRYEGTGVWLTIGYNSHRKDVLVLSSVPRCRDATKGMEKSMKKAEKKAKKKRKKWG